MDTQNPDGGWGWPLTGSSATNTAGPIGMGLLSAYAATGDASHLTAATDAGDFIKTVSPPHSTGNGIFMHALSQATGDASYGADVKTEYYDALAAGTYERNSVLYDTDGFAQLIRDNRGANTGNGNLALWDLGIAAIGASRLGVASSELDTWADHIKAEIDELDGSGNYEIIGLAGGLWALAELGIDYDPTSGLFAAASSTADLADALVDLQLANGGFTWDVNATTDDDGAVQESAYSILALSAFDHDAYFDEIYAAGNWLRDVQLLTGGWEQYPGYSLFGENNEVTGEALWGIQTVPAPGAVALALVGFGTLGHLKRRYRSS